MSVKKIPEGTAKTQKTMPHSSFGATLKCLTVSQTEFLIVPGPKADQFTLWKKIPAGYIEIAVSDNKNELDDIIPWNS